MARKSGGVGFATFGVGGIFVSEGSLPYCRTGRICNCLAPFRCVVVPRFGFMNGFIAWGNPVLLIDLSAEDSSIPSVLGSSRLPKNNPTSSLLRATNSPFESVSLDRVTCRVLLIEVAVPTRSRVMRG